jgi:FdhE protein
MRQGEVAPKGAWIGDPLGGVKAPDPLVLPDPSIRFARTADRLEALSIRHPMEAWLHFMAQLARSQHVAATTLRPLAGPSAASVASGVGTRMPPLAADQHRRDPAWLDGLATLLDLLASTTMPAPARAVIGNLRQCNTVALDALADRFLNGAVDSAEVGPALYVTASLQVYTPLTR